jgi:hypothetical protein
VIAEWIKASGNRAHGNTAGENPPKRLARTDGTCRQVLTKSVVTPGVASVDTRGQPTVYDEMITGKGKFRGAAARNAAIKKKYDRDTGEDRRLDTEMIPLAIERLGTAGEVLGKAFKLCFETTVLPVDGSSA